LIASFATALIMLLASQIWKNINSFAIYYLSNVTWTLLLLRFFPFPFFKGICYTSEYSRNRRKWQHAAICKCTLCTEYFWGKKKGKDSLHFNIMRVFYFKSLFDIKCFRLPLSVREFYKESELLMPINQDHFPLCNIQFYQDFTRYINFIKIHIVKLFVITCCWLFYDFHFM